MSNFTDLKSLLEMRDMKGDVQERFDEIADVLLNNSEIRKGDRHFFLTDIEFYWFCPEHLDIITYPRNCEAGEWFFHASGVDISFKSSVTLKLMKDKKKPVLDGTERFGGILVRGIQEKGGKKIDGPYRVMDELFDHFNAFEIPSDFPILCENNHSSKKPIHDIRKNVGLKTREEELKKVSNILKYNYLNEVSCLEEFVDNYNAFSTKKYGYHLDITSR